MPRDSARRVLELEASTIGPVGGYVVGDPVAVERRCAALHPDAPAEQETPGN